MTRPTVLSAKEITQHPLLDTDHQKMAKAMAQTARGTRERFTMLDFAAICLRATGRDYTEADERNEGSEDEWGAVVRADRALKRAAILWVHEALKACDIALIKEWPEFDEMLRSLVTLSEDTP